MSFIKKILSAIVILNSFIFSIYAHASYEEDSRKFVSSLSNNVIAIITNDKLSLDNKEQELEKIFNEVIDTKWIGRFALGKYWRTAADDQKKKYLELFDEYLILSYVPNFRKYTKETINVKSVTDLGDNEYLIATEIINHSTNKDVRVDYRIRKSDSNSYGFIIFDIVGEGVSLIHTQRSDFNTILSQNGIDYLLQQLQSKIDNLKNKK